LREDLARGGADGGEATGEVVAAGPIRIDVPRRRVILDDREVGLKPKEFDLLVHLARHPGQVFTPDHLIESVWGYDALGDTRTVRVHIRSLREKIEADASNPTLIETVRGVGYRFAG
jgi:DNA-binding response OmpR family regulator